MTGCVHMATKYNDRITWGDNLKLMKQADARNNLPDWNKEKLITQ